MKITPKNKRDYDFIVLGGGSAGIAAANMAASFQKSVLLIEQADYGGTCVNVGCVPKKYMWNVMDMMADIQRLKESNIYESADSQFNYLSLKNLRQQYINRIHKSYQMALANNYIDVIHAKASQIEAHKIQVNEEVFGGKIILICTGSMPVVPTVTGGQLGSTSNDFFELESIPRSATISGSGYIAIELAFLIAEMQQEVYGQVKTTLIARSERILKNVDSTISEKALQALKNKHINIAQNERVTLIEESNQGLQVVTNQQTIESQFHLWATGRRSNHDFLQKQLYKLDDKGNIATSERFESSIKNHFVIGDVVGDLPQLTPVAIMSSRRLVKDLCLNQITFSKKSLSLVPTVIFSNPPIATIGLTQDQAKQKNRNISVFEAEFTPMRHAISPQLSTKTYIKLICEKSSTRVLGLHMIGLHCDEILQGFAVAISMGATKENFDKTLAIHPISAEEVVTLRPLMI